MRLLVVALALALAACRSPSPRPRDFQRGIALGLFASDPEWDYGGMLHEIAALGASDVQLDVAWESGPTVAPRPGRSPSATTLRRTLAEARALGLAVTLCPLVHVDGGWRGHIVATDAWWQSYRGFVQTLADAAEAGGAARLFVGSELLRIEADRARWSALIADVRKRYHGRIVYSANWDHFADVPFWDLVDEIGVTAYAGNARAHLDALGRFAAKLHRHIVITEVGWPSARGAAEHPWQDAPEGIVDVELQRRLYADFVDALAGAPWVDGVYFWNWFGVGGVNDAHYTPRGKPAAEVVRRFFAR